MKNIFFIAGIILLFFVITMCEKESVSKISIAGTEVGGCNDEEFNDLKNAIEEQEDTILFTIRNDTLDVYVGINYICCTPFTSSSRVTNDSIIMTITDPCSELEDPCYCWCMCYYTWDFLFVEFEKKEYAFKVLIENHRTDGTVVFREGIVDLAI